jgi:hypothetical protein
MKRLLGSVIVLTALTAVVGAHHPLAAQLSFAINGGYVSSTFYGADAEDVESESGFDVGASLGIPLGGGRVALSPGVYWVQKGSGLVLDGIEGAFSTAYLEIPVLLSVGLTPPESSTAFRLFAGPQVSFETACDVSATEGTTTVEFSCDDAGIDERNTTDFGVVVGALVGFPIAESIQLQFSGGADFGLQTLDAEDDPWDIRNRSFFVNAGLAFPLGG